MPKVIGLEGGPCSGKTVALEFIQTEAERRGREVVAIPETATEMIRELGALGLHIAQVQAYDMTRYSFQKELLKRNLEKLRTAITGAGKDAIIVHDRPDNSAYVSPDQYVKMCHDLGFVANPMHQLVDTVIYLRSLALIAPSKYLQLQNTNPARHESLHEAQTLCRTTYELVSSHPNVQLVSEPIKEEMLHRVAEIVFADQSV